jgi:hypothetical protein
MPRKDGMAQASSIDVTIPDPSTLGFALPGYNVPKHRRNLLKSDEASRCLVIERRREAELLEEAENAARRARIARCDAELARLRAQPADIPDRAYLVAMGIRDWEAEKQMLEARG